MVFSGLPNFPEVARIRSGFSALYPRVWGGFFGLLPAGGWAPGNLATFRPPAPGCFDGFFGLLDCCRDLPEVANFSAGFRPLLPGPARFLPNFQGGSDC